MKISFDMLLSAALSAPFVHAKDMKHSGRGLSLRGTENAKQPVAVRSLDESLFGTPKSSKAGKQVCLEYAFVNDEVIAGSSTPLQGPTSTTPACADQYTKCFGTEDGDLTNGGDYFSEGCNDWLECLEKNPKDDGPAFNNPWFINRDVSDGQIVFEDGRVCASIPTDNGDGKSRLELWDPTYLNEPLDRFRQFKVPYDIVTASSGSNAYVNVYLRVNKDSTQYFDCSFTFSAPTTTSGSSDEIVINIDTPSNSARKRAGADDTGCTTGKSIQDYIDDNAALSNIAVMGVGNKEWYTFAINDGSTGQVNAGLSVCWGKVEFTRVDENDIQVINTYEWTTL
jgi:hypothetical protein